MSEAARGMPMTPREEKRRRYPPSPAFSQQANAKPEIYAKSFDDFWSEESKRITFFEPWTQLYEWKPPYAKWYIGGQLNVCYNCVDRHVESGLGDKVAYFGEGEQEDDRREITFGQLQKEVVRFANGLKKLGVKKGTHVGIYMGMIPDLPVAMLACTRIGAPFTVVFGGFSRQSLVARIDEIGSLEVIPPDQGSRQGKKGALEAQSDAGLRAPPPVQT